MSIVVHGAILGCSEGTAPSSLSIALGRLLKPGSGPFATVGDHASMINIAPFGLCRSLRNPRVAAATAAAQGILTPQMCVPHTPSAWTQSEGGDTIDGVAALREGACCDCRWGGRIGIQRASDGDGDAARDEVYRAGSDRM